MNNRIKIVGISGSLRKRSFNSALLREAVKLAPEKVEIEILDISQIPLYNQDLENNGNQAVLILKNKIKAADAVLFVSPEYNYSVSGVLKNAIDCASRPYGDNSFEGKPVAIMGASIGMLGTTRMQYHLRQMSVFLDMKPINRPEVMVGLAEEKFDAEGNLTDEKTKRKIKELIESLVVWTKSLRI
ncbi:MAG: FMN reductase [Parcubacteria group bacterium GW2011_GWE2_39_37]|uniref:FMN reductase n=1 Tax=Candidatus Falkowbacteria bacterium GW2011_GWF2_39_8 TaxID=1618642 RepID=A0A0G0SES0_9BACT|nr:MAG: FMN reductase [Parcubacteria group bacterium GW2011_GWE2_39_37]KKR33210.1 MAG: FMN reductase [Candidatus Falkowbacteria bacterium GW2011_GWF2_39_8]